MGVWRLNREELRVTDVTTFPTPPMSVSRQQQLNRRREKTNNNREGGQTLESKGWDLPRHTIVLKLVGDGQSVADELEFIVNELETNKVVTLAAPDNEDAWAYLNKKRVPLAIENWDNDPTDMHAKQRIQLQSSVLGEWTKDGGDFYEELHVRFKQTDNSPTYEREDGSTQGDLTITVDSQDSGYLEAKNPSTLAFDTLTPISTGSRTLRNGDQVKTETYDLSGYLFPSDPSSTGDAGLATVRQSPDFTLLQTIAATLESETELFGKMDKPVLAVAAVESATGVDAALLLIQTSSASLTSASSVSATATVFDETPIKASLESPSVVSASARVLPVKASATLASASGVDAVGDISIRQMSATLASASGVDAAPLAEALAAAALASASSVSATALTIKLPTASLASASAVSASASLLRDSVASLTSASSVSATAEIISDMTVEGFENGDLSAYSGDV